MKKDDGKQEFKVTAKAGVFVAGQRSPGEGKPLRLTEEQAEWALRAGELERDGTTKPKAKSAPKGEVKPETASES